MSGWPARVFFFGETPISRTVLALFLSTVASAQPAGSPAEELSRAPVAADANAATPSCSAEVVAAYLLELFPPATREQRQSSIRALATCRVEAAAGAIAAVLERDSDPAVRLEAIGALGKLDSPESVRALEKALLTTPAPASRMQLVDALGALHRVEAVRERLNDAAENPLVRGEALMVLERAGAGLGDEALGRLWLGNSPTVSEIAAALLARRAEIHSGEKAPAEGDVRTPATLESGKESSVLGTSPTPEKASAVPPASTSATAIVLEPSASVAAPLANAEPVLVEVPSEPPDGTLLAGVTSTVAGATLFSSLALLGQQDTLGVLLITGTAGAIIGGGTAWGLSRFGVKPSLGEAAWYANSTAWGALAGSIVFAGSGLESDKLRWGLFVGGETAGLLSGAWSAQAYEWTAAQTVLADSLFLGVALADGGTRGLFGLPPKVTPLAAIGVVPAMLFSAIVAREVHPTVNDLHFIVATTLATGWSGALIAGGAAREDFLGGVRGRGGLMAGLGLGYISSVIPSALVGAANLDPRFVDLGVPLVVGAGNALGFGFHQVLAPDDPGAWKLGAGLGGVALTLAAAVSAPYLRPGERAVSMGIVGALYGGGTWALSGAASHSGNIGPIDRARLQGGSLAGGVAGGIAGVLLSQAFAPGARDELTAAAIAGLGVSGGLGVVRLSTPSQGGADQLGVIGGAAGGLAVGVLVAHYTELRAAEVGAGLTGAAFGSLLGVLAPTLAQPTWAADRRAQGGAMVGLSLLGLGAGAAATATGASGRAVAVHTIAGLLGIGAGAGAGLMWRSETSQSARVGTFAGPLSFAALSLVADPWLRLEDGLGDSSRGLGLWGVGIGAVYGARLAQSMHPTVAPASSFGGLLMGSSVGLAAGLVLSKYYNPHRSDYILTAGATGLGHLLGGGVAGLFFAQPGRHDDVGVLLGMGLGTLSGAFIAHATELSFADYESGLAGLGYGALLGTLAPTLGDREWAGGRRANASASVGAALSAVGWAAVAHITDATAPEVAVPAIAGGLGLGFGAGLGLLWPATDFGPLGARLPSDSQQPMRIGAVAGTSTFILGSLLFDRELKLSEGLPLRAAAFGPIAATAGAVYGLMGANVVYPGDPNKTPGARSFGGLLMGASAGAASGLTLSKLYAPTAGDYVVSLGGSGLGLLFGNGFSQLAFAKGNRSDHVSALVGAAGGLIGGTMATRATTLRGADYFAGVAGIHYGVLLGALAPTVSREGAGSERQVKGSALVGLSLGAVGAAATAHLLEASPRQVLAPTLGGLLGLAGGLGAGLLFDGSQPARLGSLIGTSTAIVGVALSEPVLHLGDGLGPSVWSLSTTGLVLGMVDGNLFAGAIDPTSNRSTGAFLLGTSIGFGGGLLLSKLVAPTKWDAGVSLGVSFLGLNLGQGAALVTHSNDGTQSGLALVGSLAGTGGAALLQHVAPLKPVDLFGGFLGLSTGAIVGGLAPSLGSPDGPNFNDDATAGWSKLALSVGALSGAILQSATAAPPRTVVLGALGAADGALTGLGIGLLAAPATSQAARIGMTAGTLAGLGVGLLAWPQETLEPADAPFLTLAPLTGLWFGGWAPFALTDSSAIGVRQTAGGLAAGAFGAAAVAISLSPWVKLDSNEAWTVAATEAACSSMGGGLGLANDQLSSKGRATLLLSGSAVGLAAGGLASRLSFGDHASSKVALGAALGLSESLTFAWAARAGSSEKFTGAALFGSGVGALLGGAAAASPYALAEQAPASAGFAAWGAWMGSFAGALVNTDPHEVTLGGVVGANAGFLAGYTLLRTGAIEPGDFGWMSLFGAMGTVLGAGLGAPFSTRGTPQPVLAGLSVGPVVGMLAGYFLLPKLKALLVQDPTSTVESAPVQSIPIDAAGPSVTM